MIGSKFNQSREEIVFNTLQFAKFYISELGNVVGGNLHIVLSDGNVNDGCVKFCIQEAEKNSDWVGAALGKCLLELTEEERMEVYEACHQRFPPKPKPPTARPIDKNHPHYRGRV
jgi:hypothetical protein